MKKIRLITSGGFNILLLSVLLGSFGCGSYVDEQKPSESVKTTPSPTVSVSMDEFMNAALNGDVAVIREAVKDTDYAEQSNPDDKTALMLASFNGHAEIAKILIAAGADVLAKDSTGRTALVYAATGEDVATVEILLAEGSKVDAFDNKDHFTPLMWAAAEGRTDICRILLEAGANPDVKSVEGYKASTFA